MWKVIDQSILDCLPTISLQIHSVILHYILSLIISTEKPTITILVPFCHITLLYILTY